VGGYTRGWGCGARGGSPLLRLGTGETFHRACLRVLLNEQSQRLGNPAHFRIAIRVVTCFVPPVSNGSHTGALLTSDYSAMGIAGIYRGGFGPRLLRIESPRISMR
jgi:hypothetical protein